MSKFEINPAWDNSTEYISIESSEFKKDMETYNSLTQEILTITKTLAPKDLENPTSKTIQSLQNILIAKDKADILMHNLMVYSRCETSVDATNKPAKAIISILQKMNTSCSEAFNTVSLFMIKCEEKILREVLEHPELKFTRFYWSEQRLLKPTLLSDTEESLIKTLSNTGFSAWGQLYEALSGTIKVQLEQNGQSRTLGLAEAHSLTFSSNETDRALAWKGIQKAWEENQESAAAILNSIAGWRLDLYKKRSHTKEVHFLDFPCFDSRIQRKTLDAMMTAITNNAPALQEAGFAMAKLLGKKQLAPWDLLAPPPLKSNSEALSFKEGMTQIKNSFAKVSSELSDFVQMMEDKKWIEARVLPNKMTGAYCTGFAKSKTPRVYMTYMGSRKDISTLAHELGHAYHSWVMRDLPLAEQDYPMTLAETASIFAETVLNDTLLDAAQTKEEKIEFAWSAVSNALSLLLNIPARYVFEKSFYEKRQERALIVEEFKGLMDKAWTDCYGDLLSENDKMFWAHKLHFAITGVSFYNFPYSFGYLFSLSIYARKEKYGAEFMDKYKALLLDTGRMSAEDLIQKHLGEDITEPKFWQKSIDTVIQQLEQFKQLTA